MLDIHIIPQAGIGKGIELIGYGGTKHKFLRDGAPLQYLGHLHFKALLKEAIRLVEYEHFDSGQLEFRFDEQLHETSRSGDDDVGVGGEAFELPFVRMATQQQSVSQIRELCEVFEH